MNMKAAVPPKAAVFTQDRYEQLCSAISRLSSLKSPIDPEEMRPWFRCKEDYDFAINRLFRTGLVQMCDLGFLSEHEKESSAAIAYDRYASQNRLECFETEMRLLYATPSTIAGFPLRIHRAVFADLDLAFGDLEKLNEADSNEFAIGPDGNVVLVLANNLEIN